MSITARVSRRPVTGSTVVQAINREIVPALIEVVDAMNVAQPQIAGLLAPPFNADFGDGFSTTFTFTHGFNTYGVIAVIWDNATRTVQPLATESMPTLNTYQVSVASAPAVNELHIMISRGRG